MEIGLYVPCFLNIGQIGFIPTFHRSTAWRFFCTSTYLSTNNNTARQLTLPGCPVIGWNIYGWITFPLFATALEWWLETKWSRLSPLIGKFISYSQKTLIFFNYYFFQISTVLLFWCRIQERRAQGHSFDHWYPYQNRQGKTTSLLACPKIFWVCPRSTVDQKFIYILCLSQKILPCTFTGPKTLRPEGAENISLGLQVSDLCF